MSSNDFDFDDFSFGGDEELETSSDDGFIPDDDFESMFNQEDSQEPETEPNNTVQPSDGMQMTQRQEPNNTVQPRQSSQNRVQSNDRMQMPQRQESNGRMQMPQRQRVNQQRRQPAPQNTTEQVTNNSTQPKKKSKLPIVLVVLLIIGVVGFVILSSGKNSTPNVAKSDYKKTGRFAYDNLLTALNSYDAVIVDNMVGSVDGDSYLAQEWSYANNIESRQKFITFVCSHVNFTYPQVPQLDSAGGVVINKDGSQVMVMSDMNNGETIKVTHIDFKALSEMVKKDKSTIEKLYKDSGYCTEDYDYNEKMINLMLDYITSKVDLPTKDSDLSLEVLLGETPVISNDSELDKLLFSSEDFHSICDVFSQVATGFTGKGIEKYTVKEEQSNPEYLAWEMKFKAYYEADGGRFRKGISKWEPWYLYDENHNLILDENGQKIVEYYTVKDDNGNDWVQPPKTILVDIEKQREVAVDWVNESVIPYCFLGSYYCQNEYKGSYSPDVKVGDGTVEYPAGVGTPIITKCLGSDGKYHDIKITLIGYWKGQDAIDYAIKFSEKNRGFDVNSVIQLICYELKIENLEGKAFAFESDMFLSDKNSNNSTRTGTMYGFHEKATVEANGSIVINDWATSTELEQKYVCWGESFDRAYATVYFKVLAGEGNVPTYSAYKAFTGESQVTN